MRNETATHSTDFEKDHHWVVFLHSNGWKESRFRCVIVEISQDSINSTERRRMSNKEVVACFLTEPLSKYSGKA